MKKSILFYFIILFSVAVFPQDKKYFDAPFGGGGGYSPGWYIPNLDPLNAQLKNFGTGDLSTGGFFTSGGSGFIYLGFIPNLRVGGMGFGGSTSESATVNGFNREVIYSIGGGGLTIEYTLPFIKNIGVSIGAIIGAGSAQIELYSNKDNFNWNNLWQDVSDNNAAENISRRLENSFWILSPTLNIDIPIYRFVGFRIGAGYQLALGNNWEIENGKELSGVPSDLNGNSFFIQSGIYLGFFSF